MNHDGATSATPQVPPNSSERFRAHLKSGLRRLIEALDFLDKKTETVVEIDDLKENLKALRFETRKLARNLVDFPADYRPKRRRRRAAKEGQ